MIAPARTDPIRHVVVLALENRSFDQILGSLKAEFPELDGIDPGHPRTNFVATDRFEQQPTTRNISVTDPKHETRNVLLQIKADNAYFVLDYALEYPVSSREERAEVMGYFPPGSLPGFHTLARNFAVCDAWFSSLPGPTWPNRLFLLSGTSLGHVEMPVDLFNPNLHWYDQTTIFDRLDEKSIPWKVYAGDFPLSLLLVHQLTPQNLARLHDFESFLTDAAGSEAEFPAFAFIEPDYVGPTANDGHPPHDLRRADALVADVYNALRKNEALWMSTLFVVVFDEHGGFYDHVAPPTDAEPPDDKIHGFDFRTLGVRVPALLVSPWVERTVVKARFDHTSLLRYLCDKWELGPLGNRTAAANSFAPWIGTRAAARTDTPPVITIPPIPIGTPVELRELTDNERALQLLSEQLQTRSLASPHGAVARVMAAMANSPSVRDDVRASFRTFLETHRRN